MYTANPPGVRALNKNRQRYAVRSKGHERIEALWITFQANNGWATGFGPLLISIMRLAVPCFLAGDLGAKSVTPGEHEKQGNSYNLYSGREVEH